MAERAPLIVIGYWDGPDTSPGWPRPEWFVDVGWDPDERDLIADYLTRGGVSRAYMGYALCRICGCLNGTLELSDGTYVWPDGLRHYVVEHAVRLPERFVAHALARAEALEEAARDVGWWAIEGERMSPGAAGGGDAPASCRSSAPASPMS
jgi:hypothetical protein